MLPVAADFQSALELNPADTNALHNAQVVERAIAELVIAARLQRMAMAGLGAKPGWKVCSNN